MVSAGTVAVALLKPDLRRALFRDARLSNIAENFSHPIRRVQLGTRQDRDPFLVNYVGHPGLFALEALYLKRRGYRDGTVLLFTQVHSVLWEFAVEGSAFPPSGKDLLSDAGGAALALWVLRPVAARSSRRIRESRARIWDHGLRWLDPIEALTGRRNRDESVQVFPLVGPGAVGLGLSVRF